MRFGDILPKLLSGGNQRYAFGFFSRLLFHVSDLLDIRHDRADSQPPPTLALKRNLCRLRSKPNKNKIRVVATITV
jgi:hypothetical protein